MINLSPLLLILLVVIVIAFALIPYGTRNRRGIRIPLMTGASREPRLVRLFMRICVSGVVISLVLGIVAPPIPTSKTVVVRSNGECIRDILVIVDVSGSAKSEFDVQVASLYEFAKNRSTDCFGIVIFSGPGGSQPVPEEEYATLINHGIRNPDQLVLPLRGGMGSRTVLGQFAWGTRISGGLVVAGQFFEEQAAADAHVIILISDLGNEEKDNKKTLEVLDQLLAKNVGVYIFGVDVSKHSTLLPKLEPYIADKKIAYLSVNSEQDFTSAYKFVDAIEAAPVIIQETKIVTVDTKDSVFFALALAFIAPLVFRGLTRRRVL